MNTKIFYIVFDIIFASPKFMLDVSNYNLHSKTYREAYKYEPPIIISVCNIVLYRNVKLELNESVWWMRHISGGEDNSE